ncbi:MAG: class I SAM-dependent methyltransferase [Planctomycetota bacterium]
MKPKPKHLGPEYGAQFADPSVVEAYRLRPPYPDDTFMLLLGLLGSEPRRVLDAGCGPGEIARTLAPDVDRMDAVDASPGMIEYGMSLAGADHPNLRWACAPMELARLDPPYGLIVASQSLHWMEWDDVLPRFRAALSPEGHLVLLDAIVADPPWAKLLKELIARFSTNRDFAPYDLVEELESRGLFRLGGEAQSSTRSLERSVDEYVESLHSANGLSLDRMSPDAAMEFDRHVRALVTPHCEDGIIRLDVRGWLRWGRPLDGW